MKKTLLAGALGLSLFASSCLGPNNAFNRVHHYNQNVSENRWVNEAVHVAFLILPVYTFAWLGDVVIFNSIEWWGGENPIAAPSDA